MPPEGSPQKQKSGYTRLSDWAHLKTELYWIYEGVVQPEFRSLNHADFIGRPAYYLKQGELFVETETGQATAHAGQWIIPSERMTYRRFSDDADIISLRFAVDWPDGQQCFDSEVALVFNHADFPQLLECAENVLQAVYAILPNAGRGAKISRGDLVGYLRIREHFLSWLCSLIEIGNSLEAFAHRMGLEDDRIFEAARLLDRYPLDVEFSESELASAVHLSPRQLDRLFQETYDLSPKQYLDRRRQQEAETRLKSTREPVKRIAFDLGFSSLSYFSRWFHKKTGQSPREFREATLGED